jgi:AAA+ ATPase superfamily predicted ATPase
MSWGFYGRRDELTRVRAILDRRRWFFARITGRRRIGKTSLIHQALAAAGRQHVLYVQIPDSDATGVLSAVADFFTVFGVPGAPPRSLSAFAESLAGLIRQGYVVALDEFQYFSRQSLYEFNSHLQYQVDQLARDAGAVQGGLIVLGSLHTEMAALLEDRAAPLFNRVSDQIELNHLDIASVLEILREHTDAAPERLLLLWNLFEGVPKFYRDCYEQSALAANRRELLERMFFLSSSPLRTEADHWFLRELRGRYDTILKFVAAHPGCSNAELTDHLRQLGECEASQAGGYIKTLRDRYHMIERLQPIFAPPKARSGRFYIRDNFLRSWLAALATPAASVNFRPLSVLVEEADRRLHQAEGHGFERLVRTLYEERSRKGIGDFQLTKHVEGYWDRQGTELDLVALDEEHRIVRFGTCKRNAERLPGDLARFDGHIARFLNHRRSLREWKIERVALAPVVNSQLRAEISRRGYLPQDLGDLCHGLQ